MISEKPEYMDVVQSIVEAERVIQFRVPWYDDEGPTGEQGLSSPIQ